jgi:predicted nucleic acid-binding protein
MRVLIDTNILTRVAQKNHSHSNIAAQALERLWNQGHDVRVVPQVLYEYWSVATRPIERNGLGFSAEVASADIDRFKVLFSVLRDERGVLEPWQQIALHYNVIGKQAHDARLIAAMLKHGLTHLLTFNGSDFQRYRGITVLDPLAIAQQ